MDDTQYMRRAMALADTARLRTSPNPWVGAVVVTPGGRVFEGATEPPGGRHAEIVALDDARAEGVDPAGATLYSTLEPCDHVGRTGACVDAIIAAGITRVVTSVVDPDPNVADRGHRRLREAGIEVATGVLGDETADQLRPYLHHRRTGRPFVVLKLAATLDGRTAAADGSSRWITGEDARVAVHRLRAESDAIIVGAGTVRADDPELTTRLVDGPSPRRVVLGRAPNGARIHPCLEWTDDLPSLLDHLGREGVMQALVEGGASVAASFHRDGLVDRYVIHLAPSFMGGDDGTPLFAGAGVANIDDLQRMRIAGVRRLGDDIEVVLDRPLPSGSA